MSSLIKFICICWLFSHQVFAMQVILDERDHISLNQPLPSIINSQSITEPPHYWLSQDYDTEQFLASTAPGPHSSWHKIELIGQLNGPYSEERIISVKTHILRHLHFYLFDGDKLIKTKRFGLLDKDLLRNDNYTGPNFRFYIQNNQKLTLLIEKQNDGPVIIPMDIYSEDGFHELTRFQSLFWASIISILMAMAIYNVLVYAMHPNTSYLWYLGFHATAFCYFAGLNGFGFLLFNPSIQIWIAQNIMFLNFVLIFFVVNFANVFLEGKINTPWHARYIPQFRIITILGAIVSLLLPEYTMIPIFVVFQFLGSVFGISMGVVALMNKFKPAKYFLLSWIFTLIGGAVGMSAVVNTMPVNFFTLHGFLFGTLIELFLLSIALASRMKHMENQLLNQLYYYPDTNIANFSYLKNKLSDHVKSIKQNYSHPVMIIADMQGFREVVSLYGPNILSKLYKSYTERITHYLSKQPWSIPLPMPVGEPVYVIALPAEQLLLIVNDDHSNNESNLYDIFQQLITESEKIVNKNYKNRINFTLGCTYLEDNTIQTAFRQAQVALLTSKKHNKKYLAYDQDQDKAITDRINISNDLQLAINQNDLTIYIQPQINLDDNSINGGEILIRWNHRERGSISPAVFIPLAEQGGLIFQITQLVFIKCCRWLNQLKTKNTLNENFTVSINLSALDMAEPELIPFIESSLEQFQLESKHFILEVTESAVMDNPQLFIATIKKLKALGFQISIDDFGTGYSSMLYLQNIEANEIKIDMAFVRNIHLNEKKQHIIKAIVHLAHSSNACIVAEGIENDDELNYIKILNCDFAQGYYWCPAIPLTDFEKQYLSKQV